MNYSKARRYLALPVKGFENPEHAFRWINEMAQADWLEALSAVIRQLQDKDFKAKQKERLETLWRALRVGDFAHLQSAVNEIESYGAGTLRYSVLIRNGGGRHANMVDSITRLLAESKPYLVFVIGASHFSGSDSIPEKLRELGLNVVAQSLPN